MKSPSNNGTDMINQLTFEAIVKFRELINKQPVPLFDQGFYVPSHYLEQWIESGDAKKVNGQWRVKGYLVFTDTAWEEANQEKQ